MDFMKDDWLALGYSHEKIKSILDKGLLDSGILDTTYYAVDTTPTVNAITDIKIINNKVVMVYFGKGMEKAVCDDEDNFDLARGIEICVMKRILSSKGYSSLVANSVKKCESILNKKLEDERESKRIACKKEKEAFRKADRLKRKHAREREEQIEIQKEAYIRAKEYLDKK